MKPGTPVPELSISTLDQGHWSLTRTHPASFDLIAVYRGSFCPFCARFIKAIHSSRNDFKRLGIDLLAVSMDDEAGASRAQREWAVADLPIGYGLHLDQAREWNVFVTTREQDGQVVTFCEPAVFLVSSKKTLYASLIQSFPCGRPDVADLVAGLDYLASLGFPVRGAQ